MTMTMRKSQGVGFEDNRLIKVEGRRDKGKEVRVQHGVVLPKWKAWDYEGFSRQWSKKHLN